MLITQQFFDNLEYDIIPKPKTFIRIFLSIKKLDKEIKVEKQELKKLTEKDLSLLNGVVQKLKIK